jgi:hypothetical protein
MFVRSAAVFLLSCNILCAQEAWSPLDAVNAQRAKKGLKSLVMDNRLMSMAKKVSNKRARVNVRGHLPGWQAGHAKSEGVGWDYRHDLEGKRFRSCCLYGKKWRYAGVGISVSKYGTFYTLMVR